MSREAPSAAVRRTIAGSDVWLFAGLANDYYGVHTDAEYARGTRFGRPIAHGAYLVGLVSAAASRLAAATGRPAWYPARFAVTFLAPVYPGDTVEATVTAAADGGELPGGGELRADARVSNQNGQAVLAGQVWLRPPAPGKEGEGCTR